MESQRKRYELAPGEVLAFDINGVEYNLNNLTSLAEMHKLASGISEYVYQLPAGLFVYLTVVPDKDHTSTTGSLSGWYVTEMLSEKDARWAIGAIKTFTER